MAPYCITETDESGPSCSVSPSNSTTSGHFWEEEFPPDEILPISLPDHLPYERSLPRLLAKVCGTDDFDTVTSVKLKVITQEVCLQRLHFYMPALIELDLSGSHMNSLRDLGSGLCNLLILRVGRCNLDSLDGLFGMVTIEELYAPNNNINCVGYCAALPVLRILDLEKNNIQNLRQIEYLSMCTTLERLTLKGCPASNVSNYRDMVGSLCPKLRMLDGILLVNSGPERCCKKKEFNNEDDDSENSALSLESKTYEDDTELVAEEHIFSEKLLPPNKKLQRPMTTNGVRIKEKDSGMKYFQRTRPATAQPSRNENQAIEKEQLIDTPSKLTSGGVVCGNLAVALRGQRRRKSAWPGAKTTDQKNGIVLGNTNMESEIESHVQSIHSAVNSDCSEDQIVESQLVDVSRKWRHAYNKFRTEHRF